MNTLIYFIAFTIGGTLSTPPMKGTRCWNIMSCQNRTPGQAPDWNHRNMAICAKTYGDVVEFLHHQMPKCEVGTEVFRLGR